MPGAFGTYRRQEDLIDPSKTDDEMAEEFLRAACERSPDDWVYFINDDALRGHLQLAVARGRVTRLLADEIIYRGTTEMVDAIRRVVTSCSDIDGHSPYRKLGVNRFTADGHLHWGSSN